jgi:hypothetical protein
MLASKALQIKDHLTCPEDFQELITQAGGTNRYDEPNFKLAWSQSESVWRGGHWNTDKGSYTGYREVPLVRGVPCWLLLQWADAGMSIEMPHLKPESDVGYYMANTDIQTGMCVLGQYPYYGSYQVAKKLVATWVTDNNLNFYSFPLDIELVNMVIPVIQASLLVSLQAKIKFMEEEEEKDDKNTRDQIEAMYLDARRNPNLASTSWLEDKQRQIEKAFDQSMREKVVRMSKNSFGQGRL